MDKFGFDISYANEGTLNNPRAWEAIKNSKFKDFVIIRRGYGVSGTEDDCYKRWYENAKAAGITNISSYWFSYALSPQDAAKEAEAYVRLTEKDGLALNCLILDFENNDYWVKNGYTITPSMAQAHCEAFLNVLKNAGLNCAIYSSQYIFEDILDWRSLGVGVWNSAYSVSDSIRGWMFQYTASEYVYYQGESFGPFDANIMYG